MWHSFTTARLIDPAKRQDYLTFIETGLYDDAFAEYVNSDIECQAALLLEAEHQEDIMHQLYARDIIKRLKAQVPQLEPKWYEDVYLFFTIQEVGEEFARHVKDHPELEQALVGFLQAEQAKIQALIDLEADQAAPEADERMREFDLRFRYIRERWMQSPFSD